MKKIATILACVAFAGMAQAQQTLPDPARDYGSNTAGYMFADVLAARDNPAFNRAIAATPPMGWNSWNAFRCDVDETKIRAMADSMVSSGLAKAGYRYLVIDDCWQSSRNKDGVLVPDAKRFPSGMKALSDYVHGKGLKFGLYSAAGYKTCQGRPGSRGYEWTDARTFADWGVDYLKYDWCYMPAWQEPFDAYARMRDALVATGRPIYFSASAGLRPDVLEWAPQAAHSWRFNKDIRPCWDCTGDRAANGIMSVLDRASQLQVALRVRPGSWSDADMLEVGNHGLSMAEQRAHFALWVLLASPLMIGTDLRTLDPEALDLLRNPALVSAHQDPLGMAGFRYRDFGDTEIWRRWLKDGADGKRRDMFVLLNRGNQAREIELEVDPDTVVSDMMASMVAVPVIGQSVKLTVQPHSATVLHVAGMRFKN
ncbi:alpha-galactosidase [Novosphingobium aquae]|uniref:Alpha-galactosidase n=1 Tax=Novosphingobium aquae TaxID=3133435 RepID=A0ABU8SBC9_9SPHN